MNRRSGADDGLFLVGVTGGAASGKSTFVERLAAGGPSFVLSADHVGHAILERPAVARLLAEAFGGDILDSDGKVLRDVLGPRAFATEGSLARLNAIVHPPLLEELRERIDAAARDGFVGMAILDAALLVEWDLGGWCDLVVAVLAPPAQRIERLMRERGRTEDVARTIVLRQLPDEARARYADRTLSNDGSVADLAQRGGVLAREVWGLAGAALARRGHALPGGG